MQKTQKKKYYTLTKNYFLKVILTSVKHTHVCMVEKHAQAPHLSKVRNMFYLE